MVEETFTSRNGIKSKKTNYKKDPIIGAKSYEKDEIVKTMTEEDQLNNLRQCILDIKKELNITSPALEIAEGFETFMQNRKKTP